MSEENLAIVQRFADRVNEQDIPGFLALVDPEVEFHTFREVEQGLEGARRFAVSNGPQEHYLTHVVHEQAFDAGDLVVVSANIQRRWRETGELGDETRVGVSSRSGRARCCASRSFVTASRLSSPRGSPKESKRLLRRASGALIAVVLPAKCGRRPPAGRP